MWHLDGKEKAVVFQSRQAGAHVRVLTPIAVTRVLLLCPCNDVVLVLRWTRLWTPLGFCDAAQALWESPDREPHPVSPGSVAVSLTTNLLLFDEKYLGISVIVGHSVIYECATS